MRYLLFPFRWVDEKVQSAVDRSAFWLMEHLRCELRVLGLMLSLVTLTSLVPITIAVLAKEGPFHTKVMMTFIFCYSGRVMLTTRAAEDRSVYHWRYYIFARAIVAAMKLFVISTGVILTVTDAADAELTAPLAASLIICMLAVMGIIYLERTPRSRTEKAKKSGPAPKSATAEL